VKPGWTARKARGYEQDERERHLGDNESALGSPLARRLGGTPGVSQPAGIAQFEDCREAEQEAERQRTEDNIENGGRIERKLIEPGQSARP